MNENQWTHLGYKFDAASEHEAAGSRYALLRRDDDDGDGLLVTGEAARHFTPAAADHDGRDATTPWCIARLTPETAELLMQAFPWTRPVRRGQHRFTYGMGDRIDCATPGQIQAIAGYPVFPIFAQQSIRELQLTRRSFPDVIAAAAFAVFAADYRGGYGADGDHLKSLEEIDLALDAGCTMITLDCSEKIDTTIAKLDRDVRRQRWQELAENVRRHYLDTYADRDYPFIGHIPRSEVERIVLVFHRAIDFTQEAWEHIQKRGREVDFELSIDETVQATTPLEHYLIAREVSERGVRLSTVAPHFSGEFEKGLDYIGDTANFRSELENHQTIAEILGYRLSLHSGSDKFLIFPHFGAITSQAAHVKTAGTNWLEALRVVAICDPDLFRRSLEFAISARPEAERYYRVTSRVEEIPVLAEVSDSDLVSLIDIPASRQTLHITYGLLLHQPWFREPFFKLLRREAGRYADFLTRHTRRHLDALGLKRS
ncbi:MAG: tagaturonate epimerase family protein [Bacillota bacterium]|nr:tagaturonate epimerase family protein [Bacillota bacterium]